MAEYVMYNKLRHWPRRVLAVVLVLLALLAVAGLTVRHIYNQNIGPLDSDTRTFNIVIASGSSPKTIAEQLKTAHLIRSSWPLEWYVRSHELQTKLQAGTYAVSSSQSIPQIVDMISSGNIVKNVIIILPGQRLDQLKDAFLNAKFDKSAVEAAFDPAQYADIPALADKPASANLEGFLYPDSFQKDSATKPSVIVRKSIEELGVKLTPDLRAAYAKQGLSVFQAITIASIVEQEVSKTSDRAQAAQVFLKRLQIDMPLGSDVTAFYGALLAGQKTSTTYDSPYNTLLHKGLPPGPISNVSESSLTAVAHPAKTDWLYFVAGDDGNTYFSKTLEEHQALTNQYCHKLCNL